MLFFWGEEMKSIPEYVIKMRQKIGHERLLLVGACVIFRKFYRKDLVTASELQVNGACQEDYWN